MAKQEEVIKGLEWILNDIEENGHYQVSYYADEIRKALSLLKEQKAEIERLRKPDREHAEHDGVGCLGYSGCRQDDEPIDACKGCREYTGNRSGDGDLDG